MIDAAKLNWHMFAVADAGAIDLTIGHNDLDLLADPNAAIGVQARRDAGDPWAWFTATFRCTLPGVPGVCGESGVASCSFRGGESVVLPGDVVTWCRVRAVRQLDAEVEALARLAADLRFDPGFDPKPGDIVRHRAAPGGRAGWLRVLEEPADVPAEGRTAPAGELWLAPLNPAIFGTGRLTLPRNELAVVAAGVA